jgi:hypothetical protein
MRYKVMFNTGEESKEGEAKGRRKQWRGREGS